ncbi:MAG: PEGA domain-containing protein [Bacteroidaceae bacterium]|nr:PEGA domain-containing protein [Bacteroidaceae bacterium]
MRTFLTSLLLTCIFATTINAQEYSIKSVTYRQKDARARTAPRNDNNGTPCAMVKVDIIGINDLKFPDAVGDVDYSLGEYIVYLSENTKSLRYNSASKNFSGEIIFADYDITIAQKSVYQIVFESENKMRAAVFSVYPETATLSFDGKIVNLDETGMAIVETSIGKYEYNVTCEGYAPVSGTIELIDEEMTTITNVTMEEKKFPLIINCKPDSAELFIDNVSYGKIKDAGNIEVTEGTHIIQLKSPTYNDFSKQIYVQAGESATLDVALVQMEQERIVLKKERTRTSISIRPSHHITIGGELYDKSKYFGYEWGAKIEYTYTHTFLGVFQIQPGLSLGLMTFDKEHKQELYGDSIKSESYFLEIPLQLGIGIPFGRFNQNTLSILAGGYARGYMIEKDDEGDNDDKSKISARETTTPQKQIDDKEYDYDYGLRATIRLDIKSFSISGECSHSLNGGRLYPAIKLGYRFY